jgi:hypothetical protein
VMHSLYSCVCDVLVVCAHGVRRWRGRELLSGVFMRGHGLCGCGPACEALLMIRQMPRILQCVMHVNVCRLEYSFPSIIYKFDDRTHDLRFYWLGDRTAAPTDRWRLARADRRQWYSYVYEPGGRTER